MNAADEMGASVAITGYDNLPFSSFARINLTTIDPQSQLMGRRAAEVLVERLNGERHEPSEEFIEPLLIVRESSRR